jgi:TPR repeat protein
MATPDSTQPEDYSNLVFTQDKGRNYLFYIVIIVFVLIVVGYFSFFSSDEDEIVIEPPMGSEQSGPITRQQIQATQGSSPTAGDQKQDAAAEPLSSAESKPVPTPVATNPGEAARALIASVRQGEENLTLQQQYEKASEFQHKGMMTDAYLLYFYAARKGDGPSAFELASMHDPAYFKTGNDLLDAADPVQAYKWYTIAAEHQVEEARTRLSALRDSIEAAAAEGDLSAQRLLLNWK